MTFSGRNSQESRGKRKEYTYVYSLQPPNTGLIPSPKGTRLKKPYSLDCCPGPTPEHPYYNEKKLFGEDMKTILGLDLGVASVGWALFEKDENGTPKRLIDLGSFVFDQIENKKDGKTENIGRREKRSMRRQRRRKQRRLISAKVLFSRSLGIRFDSLDLTKFPSPFELKIKGLEKQLSKEELSIALYHYMKYRGFKSNRKNANGDADEKKMLAKYKEVENELKTAALTVTPLLMKKAEERGGMKTGARIHNTSEESNLTVTRKMYLDEINALLDKQLSFGVITKAFKDEFIALFQKQRDFSEGPDKPSPYHVDFANLIARCQFDDEICAPKDSVSAKRFVLLSSLVNLRYKPSADSSYIGLTPDQIQAAEAIGIAKSSLTYKDIFDKVVKCKPYRVKNLELTRKESAAIYKDLVDDNGVVKDYEALGEARNKKLMGKTFFSNSDLVMEFVKRTKKTGEVFSDDFIDRAASILIRCKTDERIESVGLEEGLTPAEVALVKEMPDCKAAINLSLPLCRTLIPLLRQGKTYDQAMAEAGHSHSVKERSSSGIKRLPDIEKALKDAKITLRNPVVKHTLVQVIRVVNAVIDTYGLPDEFSIELARELKKNFEERKAILGEQLDNQRHNLDLRKEMMLKYSALFRTFEQTRGDALLKYKLFKEQGGVSPYTNQPINEYKMFDNNLYQIDHILPYSRSFDDSFVNKVLVEAKENQEKGNRTPFEHYGESSPINDFLAHHFIGRNKAEKLRAKSFDVSEFLNKDFQDTAYLSRLAKELLEFYLLDEGKHVNVVPGSLTDKLRVMWHVAGRTHSYIKGSSFETLYHAKPVDAYLLDDIVCGKDSVTFVFKMEGLDKTFAAEVKAIKPKKDRSLDLSSEQLNRGIQYCAENAPAVRAKYLGNGSITASEMVTKVFSSPDGSSEVPEIMSKVVLAAYSQVLADSNKKIRSNDLHHALDACVIACATPGMLKSVTEFFKREESREAYAQQGDKMRIVPLPYPDFDKEVLARVYERNEDKLFEILRSLPMYKDNPPTKPSVHVLIPTRLPKKNIEGALSKETIYGERDGALWSRISVKDLPDKIDYSAIYNPNGGNQAVIDAIKTWDASGREGYPMLKKKGTPIKKVRVKVADGVDGRIIGKVDLSNGRYAENGECVRVAVYRKNESDSRLYFVPLYYRQIAQRRRYLKNPKKVKEPRFMVMWQKGENGRCEIGLQELTKNYSLVGEFGRFSLLEIVVGKAKGCIYSGGASSGILEIYSLLGDDEDLAAAGLITKETVGGRHQQTVSTIAAIKGRNISTLGHIS